MATTAEGIATIQRLAAQRLEAAGVFGEVRVERERVVCAARDSAAPAEYRLGLEGGRLWVSLVTADRWLSQSIEADLVHTGDDLGELLEEELADQGLSVGRLPFEHFRSEDRLFTFRTPLPEFAGDDAGRADAAARVVLAYEACFRNLGDMSGSEEE